MPGFYLKRMVMENFNSKEVDPDIADSIDFMVENVSVVTIYIQILQSTHCGPCSCFLNRTQIIFAIYEWKINSFILFVIYLFIGILLLQFLLQFSSSDRYE
jgi:uncharacterized membrane protein